VNRPSSAFGLLLGFLALTMFAVSSTTRSTSVKTGANFADRAAIRRQAALARMSALGAAVENTPAADLFNDQALCVPDSIESVSIGASSAAVAGGDGSLPSLRGGATRRLMPAHIEIIRNDDSTLTTADGRTYDAAYDYAVLGIRDVQAPITSAAIKEELRELSATDIATVFQSIVREKSTGSRNATRKSQRRASLEGIRSLADSVVRVL